MFCENCGAKLPDDAVFCTNCGAKQEPLEEQAPEQAQPAQQPPQQPAQPYTQVPPQQPNPPFQSAPPQQPRQAYQQPYPQQPWGQPPMQAQKKSKTGLIVGIIALVVALIAGALVYFLVLRKNDDDPKSTEPASSSEQAVKPTSSELEPTDAPTAARLTAGQTFTDGDLEIVMDDAGLWPLEASFGDDDCVYAQIWVHLINNGASELPAPDYTCFFVHFDGRLPNWMETIKGQPGDQLKTMFGADDRSYLMGEITENKALYDDDYIENVGMIPAGGTLDTYLLYQIPKEDTAVTVYYYGSKADAQANKPPKAIFSLNMSAQPPAPQVAQYDDPAAYAEKVSTYQRWDPACTDLYVEKAWTHEEVLGRMERNHELRIVEPRALNGGWIGVSKAKEDTTTDYFNVDLQIAADGSVRMEVDWYLNFDEDTKEYGDDTGYDNDIYTGTWSEDGTMHLVAEYDSTDVIDIYLFSQDTENDIQYAFGDNEYGGKQYTFNLVRPAWVQAEYMDEDYVNELKANVQYSDLDPEGRGAVEPSNPGSEFEAVGSPDVDADFSWFNEYLSNFVEGEKEIGNDRLLDPTKLNGRWFMTVAYREGGETVVQELYTAVLTIDDDGVAKLVVTPYRINYGEGWKTLEGNVTSFDGRFRDGTITAMSNDANLTISGFYINDAGTWMFAVGESLNQSGETGYVGLSRP